jgi:hypothetical protein
MSVKRRAVLRGAGAVAIPLALGSSACAVDPPGSPLRGGDLPRDRAATFRALAPGQPPETLTGPESRWASGAEEPARAELTPDGLLLVTLPGHRAWAAPRLPVAPLDAIPDGHVEDVTWEATIGIEQRYFVVCDLRFAGQPGAVLIQATPYDLQVFHDPDRPSGGRSESVSHLVDGAPEHYWRLHLAGGRLDLFLDGSIIWSLEGPRALSRLAFGETRTDDAHGGSMLLRDLTYVRRPA